MWVDQTASDGMAASVGTLKHRVEVVYRHQDGVGRLFVDGREVPGYIRGIWTPLDFAEGEVTIRVVSVGARLTLEARDGDRYLPGSRKI